MATLVAVGAPGPAQGNQRDATMSGAVGGAPMVGMTRRLRSGMPAQLDLWSPGRSLIGLPYFIAVDVQNDMSLGLPLALPGEPGAVALTSTLVPLVNTFAGGAGALGLPSSGMQITIPIPSSSRAGTVVFQAAVADPVALNGYAVTPITGGRLGVIPTLTPIFATTIVLGQFGYSTHPADLDGDGLPEIIAGARKDNGTIPTTGRVYVYDGVTGVQLFVLDDPSPDADSEFGVSVSTGDVNGDGQVDIVVGARESTYNPGMVMDAGQVVVFFGPDYSTTYTIDPVLPEIDGRFGHRTICADFDGDGFTDLAVSSTGATVSGVIKAGRIDVFYGPSLSPGLIVDNPSPGDTDRFGYRFCAEDLDDDGFDELVVATPFKELIAGTDDESGAIYVLAGPSFTVRNYFPNPFPSVSGLLGADVSCRDLDGDGDVDIIAGAELDDSGGLAGQGSVWLLYGPDFTTTLQVFAPVPEIDAGFGSGCDAGDFDQDGIMDLMVGEFHYSGPAFRTGRAHILYGPDYLTGETVEEPITGSNYQFGRRIRAADLDGDGDAEMVVGVPQSSASGGSRAGAVWIVEN